MALSQKKLTVKEQKFCKEYIKDFIGTKAAIRAGYSKKTAAEIASQNLKKLHISEYIAELQRKLPEETGITPAMIAAEFVKIGFANIQDFVNGGNSILELKHLDSAKVAAVSGVKTTIANDGSIRTEIKFHDKVSALVNLARMHGMFNKDNEQKAPVINLDALTADQLMKVLDAQKAVDGK